ncbi:MAG: DUF2142 domain-containing protein [Bacilli bacterium]|nr:DUF2142 domain-containing protein [Bacilli bacterium]
MKNIFKSIYGFINLINQKYKNLFKTKLKYILQFFPSNIYLLILFIVLLVLVTPKLINNKVTVYATEYGTVIPDEIVDKSIYQEIDTTNISRINELAIKFSTYMRKNNSIYQLLVYKNDDIFYKENIDASKLKDNEFGVFKINKKVDKDAKYKFEIKPIKVKKGNGITISTDKEGNYTYRLYDKSNFYNETIFLAFIFLILFFVINYLINNGKIKNENHYFKIMSIYFILIALVFPPLFEPDSYYHFDRAYTVSQNNIIDFIKSNTLKSELYPSNIDCLNYGNDGNIENEVYDKESITECFKSKELITNKDEIRADNKIAFIFSALGIKIAMLFTNSPMIIYYVGRFFNMIAAFFIILFALKIAPNHKRILLSFVMIPVFMQQMCSYSYDSILNALCILIIAYLLKFFSNNEKIRTRDLIIYLISILVLFIIKQPYVLVGLPILFVNKEKFGKKKINKYIYLFIIAVCLGILFFIPKLEKDVVITENSEGRGMTLSSLFNIKKTLQLIYYTIRYNLHFYLETFIGGLAWLNYTYLSKVLIYFYLLFLGIGILSEKQEIKMKRLIKIIIILINIALIFGIFLAMYLAWTKPTSSTIEGVQGRYFYAPVLCILLCLIPKKNKINISNETFYTFFNISSLIYLITMLYLFY